MATREPIRCSSSKARLRPTGPPPLMVAPNTCSVPRRRGQVGRLNRSPLNSGPGVCGLESEGLVPDHDLITGLELVDADRRTVDPGAVAAAAIVEHVAGR